VADEPIAEVWSGERLADALEHSVDMADGDEVELVREAARRVRGVSETPIDLIVEADETLAIFHDPKRGPSRVEVLIRSLRDALEDARAEIVRLTEGIARLQAMIVNAGYIIGSLSSHAPGDGVTDASTDQCRYCGEPWPCSTAQWRDAMSEEVDRG
jgi:hypothetical protein